MLLKCPLQSFYHVLVWIDECKRDGRRRGNETSLLAHGWPGLWSRMALLALLAADQSYVPFFTELQNFRK